MAAQSRPVQRLARQLVPVRPGLSRAYGSARRARQAALDVEERLVIAHAGEIHDTAMVTGPGTGTLSTTRHGERADPEGADIADRGDPYGHE